MTNEKFSPASDVSKELGVVVLSCDRYTDIWEAFYRCFQTYWSDCAFDVYHISDARPYTGFSGAYPAEKVTNLLPGAPTEWSARLLYGLERIKQNYVLLLLEDYLAIKRVENARLAACLSLMQETDAACFRLLPCPPPTGVFKGAQTLSMKVGETAAGAPYRASTQAAIWKRETLIRLLDPIENVWDFEEYGSQRANDIAESFLCLFPTDGAKRMEEGDYPYTYLVTAVVRAKWTREAYRFCTDMGVKIDTNYRGIETNMDIFKRTRYGKSPFPVRHIFDFLHSRVNV